MLCSSAARVRPSAMPRKSVCVSQLTALMMEQRSKFTVKGISAEFVGQLQQDILALTAVKSGKVQLLYFSPECILSNPQWREMLLLSVYQQNLVALVVDEAHCITMWYVCTLQIYRGTRTCLINLISIAGGNAFKLTTVV